MAKVEFILIGLICIGFLYFFPIMQIPAAGTMSGLAGSELAISGGVNVNQAITLSQLASLCSNPTIGALAAAFNGGYYCQVYTGIFYIGWIIGLILIVYGLIPEKDKPADGK